MRISVKNDDDQATERSKQKNMSLLDVIASFSKSG